MAARSMWKGAVSFGLVNVPVQLFGAVNPKEVQFHQLRKSDNSRIQYKRVAAADGKEVAYEEIIKGYPIDDDNIVPIQPDELKALDAPEDRNIRIVQFVSESEIDPIFYEHPYYLMPDKKAEHAYLLLLEAMHKSKKVAVARMTLRNKEYTVVLKPQKHTIQLYTMRYVEEIKSEKELPLETLRDEKVDPKEVNVALQLIESISGEFHPEEYHDQFAQRVKDLIAEKVKGHKVKTPKTVTPTQTNVVDLMAALKASVDQHSQSKKKTLKGKKSA